MLLSEWTRKEIIDGNHAVKLGLPGNPDLVIDEKSGRIKEIIIATSPFRKKSKSWRIPWNSIIKIGDDFVIIDTVKLTSQPPAE
ncbi:YlmC/YmxH family sporulation protein [Salibacterium aidingense]|uniref:YlmC/YmxH family sporulation protein n=1 Tax=Salibacterium aidingense TaxID=384933 RepID=UPI00040868D4|nr:YlmC/YmxH family sporulation protein [Salibacterium aidingense]